ncbi:hypothetical protein TNCV_4346581 [Trichonephila clavipes]|nr:hypothetical protein TNCV_4346581 [Trichonephila clavipes]
MHSAELTIIFFDRFAAISLVKLVEEDASFEAPDHLHGVILQNWVGIESTRHFYSAQGHTPGVQLALVCDEFRGPRFDIVRQVWP